MARLPASITTADGTLLRLREWPIAGAARGTVLMVHGLSEHSGRYAPVAARINAWGWHAVGYDQRGHGVSSGARGAVAAEDSLLSDLAQVIDAVQAALPAPLLLFGHSMGGLVAARLVAARAGEAAWARPVDALVLSSPALDLGLSAVQKVLLGVLGPLAPNLAVSNGLKHEWISRDPAIVAAYVADPLVHGRVTARLVQFMLDSVEFVRQRTASWSVPTLLLFAGADRCVCATGSRAFAAAAPNPVVQAQEFPALFHEIFNEPEQQQVFDALAAWLARRGR